MRPTRAVRNAEDRRRVPDIDIYPGDVPVSWRVTIRENGVPVDITNSVVSAPVTDDGVEVSALRVEKVDPANGVVLLTLTQAVYAAVGRYSTWRFRENTIFRHPLIAGRIVKKV